MRLFRKRKGLTKNDLLLIAMIVAVFPELGKYAIPKLCLHLALRAD